MNNEFRVKRLLRLFHSIAGHESPRSKAFDAWPESTRSALSTEAQLSEDERPFLAYVKGNQEWTILTLVRIVWKRNGCVSEMLIEHIHEATIPEEVLRTLSPDSKRSISTLKLVGNDGSEALVPFERGAAFGGFWNVVKMMIAQSKR